MSGRRWSGRRASVAAAGVLATAAIAAAGTAGVAAAGPATPPASVKGKAAAEPLPYQDPSLAVPARVTDLLARMTLEEKVGQMTQAERGQVVDDPSLITRQALGSVLSGGGSTPRENTPEGWADMVDRFQRAALDTRLGIPLVYGIDAVHGNGNALGATIFPHNIGLGATRNPDLVRRAARITAEETRATGPQWTFAPCLCVAKDDRWGRTYESFGEDPGLVSEMAVAIDGLQGRNARGLADPDRVLATAKHFAGDGDTEYGTGNPANNFTIDQGIVVTSREAFRRDALAPFFPAVQRHRAGSVMPSYSSVDWTEDGVGDPIKMHAHRELITGVLKGEMGFDGFVISDWEAVRQLPGDWPTQVRTSVNAGVDMFMEPNRFRSFAATVIEEVIAGRIPRARIDDAVRRILTKKFELGLFERPFTDRRYADQIGSAAHRRVARRAVAQSQVLLRNDAATLPLDTDADLYVAGSNADNIGNQAGGWTLTWQGGSTNEIPGTTVLEGIRQTLRRGGTATFSEDASREIRPTDTGVVVVGETPYSEGWGDVGGPRWAFDPGDANRPRPVKDMQLSSADKAAVDKVCAAAAKCVVVVISGRPLIIEPAQLGAIDALVAAWLPGSEGDGVADTLFGRVPFTGKLPVTWPRTLAQEPINVGDATYDPLYPFGHGLRTE